MEYRRLGNSGLQVSALSLGSWVTFANQMDTQAAQTMIATAYEAGVNYFDNAEVYAHGQSECIMGEALKRLNYRRDTWCISSKVFGGPVANPAPTQRGLSRKHIMEACHAALRRLQVDYLDLFFCHRPDPETPIEEIVRTMNTLIGQGKIFYWGTSEWSSGEIATAHAVAARAGLEGPTMEQPEYNLFHRRRVEIEYAPLYRDFGLGTTVWSPLASGILSGKYSQGIPEHSRATVAGYEWLHDKIQSDTGRAKVEAAGRLAAIAGELGATSAQVALAWCLSKPHVSTAILGASSPQQLQENLGAIDIYKRLDEATVQRLEEITEPLAN